MNEPEEPGGNWFPVPPTMATNEKLLRGSAAALRMWHALAAMVRWKNDRTGKYRAGECWPSQRYLQERYGWSFHTINAGIAELIREQLLDVRVAALGSAHYFLRGFVAFGGEPAEGGGCSENQSRDALKIEAGCSENQSRGALKIRAERSGRERYGKNERGDCSDFQSSPEEPPLEGSDSVLGLVRDAGLWGSERQLRRFARALQRRLGLGRAQAFLGLPAVAGRDVIKLGDLVTAFEAASDDGAPRPRRRCPEPDCVGGNVPDQEAMRGVLGGRAVWKPCPRCAALAAGSGN